MNITLKYQLIIILFSVNLTFGQNKRDIIINDSIYPIMHNPDNYLEVKNRILSLEKNYGYEVELKYSFINYSYQNNDISFFKKELSTLVEKYGFQLIYLNGRESYYDAITKGELAEWFKKMFLKNHFVWLENNFDKQIDLKKLNDIKNKDQLIDIYTGKVIKEVNLDSIQIVKISNLLNEFFFTNISESNQITIKNDNFPTGKSFALIQNDFYVAELHNLQSKLNIERFWSLFYPYFKKAYLNNEITFGTFKTYDQMSFVHFGNQHFGLIEIDKIPDIYKKENMTEVPIVNLEFYKKIKKEFEWR